MSSAGSRSGRAPRARPVTRSYTAWPDQPDRARDPSLRRWEHGSRGLVARHPTDVDPADRRPGRDRPALGERHAAEGRADEHEDAGDDDATTTGPGGGACGAGLGDERKMSDTWLKLAEAP